MMEDIIIEIIAEIVDLMEIMVEIVNIKSADRHCQVNSEIDRDIGRIKHPTVTQKPIT